MNYNIFLEHLEPVEIGLDSSSFELHRDAFWGALKRSSKGARRVLSSKYTLAKVAEGYFDIKAFFSVALQEAEGDGQVTQPLKIECVFHGHFHAPDPVVREHAQKFTEGDSWLVFWPFFRQFVSDTTARMAIPPIIVPMALGPGEYSYRRRTVGAKPGADQASTKAAPKRLKGSGKRVPERKAGNEK